MMSRIPSSASCSFSNSFPSPPLPLSSVVSSVSLPPPLLPPATTSSSHSTMSSGIFLPFAPRQIRQHPLREFGVVLTISSCAIPFLQMQQQQNHHHHHQQQQQKQQKQQKQQMRCAINFKSNYAK